MSLTRREFVALSLAASGAAVFIGPFAQPARAATSRPRSLTTLGPLLAPDENGVRLPKGFRSRIVARSGQPPIPDTRFVWHDAPDGGAVFATEDHGWIYVSNSEVANRRGGAGALRFDREGRLIDAYSILSGTTLNCAGGGTPWGTWLSCEEHLEGVVWECDPTGKASAQARPALGIFKHEAAAVDPRRRRLYLTEDMPDGRFYRFTPAASHGGRADLERGVLEAAEVTAGSVRWHRIEDPSGKNVPTRHQAPATTAFDGGEGCWQANGIVYFTTKGDDRVWAHAIAAERMRVLYDPDRPDPVLMGVDNVTGSAAGDVLVAEDHGDMQIVALTAAGAAVAILQVVGQDSSEIAGPAFDPSGTRLYFSSQRGISGADNGGLTYEVTGPFR